jgi:hypothetical protein
MTNLRDLDLSMTLQIESKPLSASGNLSLDMAWYTCAMHSGIIQNLKMVGN